MAAALASTTSGTLIATAGSDEKTKLAFELGADEVINHSQQNIAAEIKKLTDKRGADVVFEHVGPAVFEDCLNSLATGGRLVTCGATTGPKVSPANSFMFSVAPVRIVGS